MTAAGVLNRAHQSGERKSVFGKDIALVDNSIQGLSTPATSSRQLC
jgi:hypothetical protein